MIDDEIVFGSPNEPRWEPDPNEMDVNSNKFYIGDMAVVVSTKEQGEVIGVWMDESRHCWRYRLRGLNHCGASWWKEDMLKRPSEMR
jgi:hypothetical protein